MPATTNPSVVRARSSGAASRRVPLRRNEEFFYRETSPGPRPPSRATGSRRIPLTRQLAYYDLNQPSPVNAYTPGPAAPGAARGIPITRQFAFYNVRTSGASVDGAAANAQTSSTAGAQQPSATAGLGDMVAALLVESAKRKRTFADVATGDMKRRRVEPNAQPPSRAAGETGTPSSTPTGATASTHYHSTAAAASSAARNAPTAPSKPAGTGQAPRQIAKMPKRGALAGPSTPPRGLATVPSRPPPAPEPKRVRGKRASSGSSMGAEDENEDAPASA